MKTELVNIDLHILNSIAPTMDPYDVWTLNTGQKVKGLFYKYKYLGTGPAALITVFDTYINNAARLFYKKREYPMVHAYRVLICLELYLLKQEEKYLNIANDSLEWLAVNNCKNYNGFCWGANMPWVSKNARYVSTIPYITNTPYVLEAFIKFESITGNKKYRDIITSVFDFLEKDIKIMFSSESMLALSYSPFKEKRIVINANAYAMYAYAMLLPYRKNETQFITDKIIRIYNFIINQQSKKGAWLYYADNLEGNFIDCFHSCFILKNIYKTSKYIDLKDHEKIMGLGYEYLKNNFWDQKRKLFKRFVLSDKFSLVKFDLYDNAEMLNLTTLFKDKYLYDEISKSIELNFVRGDDIYSDIVFPNKLINRNSYRWAVMPYLHAISHSLE